MDGPHFDPDDDVTVVGDHELVAELRRQSTAPCRPHGRPLPPPRLPMVTSPAAPSLGSLPAAPRAVTTAVPFSSWYEDAWEDDDERSPLVWVVLACCVAAAVVVALLLVR